MVIDCKNHNFQTPQKEVRTPADVSAWERSEAYQDIFGFLVSMNDAVRGKKLSSKCHQSQTVLAVGEMIDQLTGWINDIPPVDQPQRYGNKAFRDFYAKICETGEILLRAALPKELHQAVPEVAVYLQESIGNSTRIDYGTGHELAFIMFLTCLFKIGALKEEDSQATVTVIFKKYMNFVRKLQISYKMEPAGSQGVWSLDDYQFIPFIWGSSQLHMHPKISPELFTNERVVHEFAEEYLFLGCIKFILSVKTGPFAEHSNQLWNISGVQSWTKINQGLFKMYKAEVLNKFPVVQHVLFGSILSIEPTDYVSYHPPGPGVMGSRMPTASRNPPMGAMGAAMGTMPILGTMPQVGSMPPRGGVGR